MIRDNFTRSVTDGWGTASEGFPWALYADVGGTTHFDVTGTKGTITGTASDFIHMATQPFVVSEGEGSYTFQVDKVPTGGTLSLGMLLMAQPGFANAYFNFEFIINPGGDVTPRIVRRGGSGSLTYFTGSDVVGLVVAATDIRVRCEFWIENGTQLHARSKIWLLSQQEPVAWNTDVVITEPDWIQGQVGMRANFTAGILNGPIVVSFDNFEFVLSSPIFFGSASNPADNGVLSAATVGVTPPTGMIVGDLVILTGVWRDTTPTLPIWPATPSTTGGQSWRQIGGVINGFNVSAQRYMCRFNGVWAADPVIGPTGAAADAIVGYMTVFRPSDSCADWGLESESQSFLSDDTTPYDLLYTDLLTTRNNTVNFVEWHGSVLRVMALVSSPGWANPSGITQVRNTSGSDVQVSGAYKILSVPGSPGTVTNETVDGVTSQGASRCVIFEVPRKTVILPSRSRGRVR